MLGRRKGSFTPNGSYAYRLTYKDQRRIDRLIEQEKPDEVVKELIRLYVYAVMEVDDFYRNSYDGGIYVYTDAERARRFAERLAAEVTVQEIAFPDILQLRCQGFDVPIYVNKTVRGDSRGFVQWLPFKDGGVCRIGRTMTAADLASMVNS